MKTIRKLLAFVSVTCLVASPVALADSGSHKTDAPVFWTYDVGGEMVGTSTVRRTKHGITAQIKTTGLTAGHAMTMWIIFFNNPDACDTPGACDPNVDGGDPTTGFDFHYGAGTIANGGTTTLSGHLRAGETSTSGVLETGMGEGVPLLNPFGAQVWLAVHSHGPAQTGQDLAAQMSSFLGGCEPPLLGGPDGIADSPADIPANDGECTTHQIAFHSR
jgi:hypothetical protein